MIQTSGFQVGAMPTYTPVNPSLVAFNPTEVSDGMLKAFRISNALEELKASKAKQAELAATRSARIAMENAVAGSNTAKAVAETPMHAQRTGYESQKIDLDSRLLFPKFEYELGDLGFKTARTAANKEMLPSVIDTEKAVNKAAGDKAKAEAAYVAPEALARASMADANRAAANNAISNADAQGKLQGMKTQDEIANFNALSAIKTKLALRAEEMYDADLEAKKAEAQYRKDMGAAANLKGAAAVKQEVAGLQRYLDSLMKTEFLSPDGKMMVSPMQYAQQFYSGGYKIRKDESGSNVMEGQGPVTGKWNPFVDNVNQEMDPNARQVLVDILNTRDAIRAKTGLIQRLEAGESAPAPKEQAQTQPKVGTDPLTGPPVGTISTLPDGSKVMRVTGGTNSKDKWVKVQ
jgi:hypothetical protein